MSSQQWLIIFLTSLFFKMIEVNFKKEKTLNQIYLFCALISGSILFTYHLLPQRYDRIETKKINVVKGNGPSQVIEVTRKLEATNYLWGLIKDSDAKWVEE